MVTVHTYACRKCSLHFSDDDWQLRCVAPAPRGRQASDEQRDKRPHEVLAPEAIEALSAAPQVSIDVQNATSSEERVNALRKMIATMQGSKP